MAILWQESRGGIYEWSQTQKLVFVYDLVDVKDSSGVTRASGLS